MSIKNILPVNENILRARFPVVLQRIHEIGDRKSESFFYDDTVEGNCLMIQRGEEFFLTNSFLISCLIVLSS